MSSIEQIHAALREAFERHPEAVEGKSAEDIGALIIEAITPSIVAMLTESERKLAQKDKLLQQCRAAVTALIEYGNDPVVFH